VTLGLGIYLHLTTGFLVPKNFAKGESRIVSLILTAVLREVLMPHFKDEIK
jgi:hypothetical protein